MAIGIVRATIDADGSHSFPVRSVWGQCRLWEEPILPTDPPVPTDMWLLFGDFDALDPAVKRVRISDQAVFELKREEHFTRTGATLTDYGVTRVDAEGRAKRRSFHVDLIVPKALIDSYR